MSIQSVFAIDNEAAIFSLKIEDDVIRPVGMWRSSPDDRDLGAAAIAHSTGSEVSFIVSPDPGSEDSFLKLSLSQDGISNIKVSRDFKPFIALATLARLERKKQFDPSQYEGWPRMKAELRRGQLNQSVGVMALLQGVIEAKRILDRPDFIYHATVDSSEKEKQKAYGRLYGIL